MGCCGSVSGEWLLNQSLLYGYLINEDKLDTIWNAYKVNNNDHGGIEYDEFEMILTSALQIFDQIEPGQPPLWDVVQKKLKGMTAEKMEELNEIAKEVVPKIAMKFDKNGDGVISFEEFKLVGKYLKEEFIKKLKGQ
eukprot:12876_1